MTRRASGGAAILLAIVAAPVWASRPAEAAPPTLVVTREGPYRAVAECSYARLAARHQGVTRSTLESLGLVEVTEEVGGSRIWSIGFVDAGSKSTQVEVRMSSLNTAEARRLADEISACGGD